MPRSLILLRADLKFGVYDASSHRLGHAHASMGATLGSLHLFDACVVFLKALHSTVAVASSRDALNGVVGTGEGRDVRNLVLDGGLADSAFVLDGIALCPRRVDDEVHLLVQDNIENVRAAFGDFVHHFALDTGGFVEFGGTFGSVDLEAELLEFLTDFDGLFRQVNLIGQANQHGTFIREEGTCGFLALVVSEGVVIGEAEDFAGGAHFGAEHRVHLRELVEGEHGFLGTVVVELLVLELEVFELRAEHQAGCEAGHLGVTNLGDQRHRAGGTRVGFEDEHLAVFDSVLHVHEAANVEGFGNLPRVILDGREVFLRDGHRRDDAGRVTGVDTGKFHVFHHGRDVNVFAVREGVGFAFQSVVEEAVDEERTVRGHAHGLRHVFAEHVFVVDDFHAAAAEHETRADHHRVAADLLDASEGFVNVGGHAAFRHRDAELVHHLAEQVAVFGDIDGVDARTENLDAFVGKCAGDVQRSLTTELHDNAGRLFQKPLRLGYDRSNKFDVRITRLTKF